MSLEDAMPLTIWRSPENDSRHVVAHGFEVGKDDSIAICDSAETAARIAACVNACEGVPVEWLIERAAYIAESLGEDGYGNFVSIDEELKSVSTDLRNCDSELQGRRRRIVDDLIPKLSTACKQRNAAVAELKLAVVAIEHSEPAIMNCPMPYERHDQALAAVKSALVFCETTK